jgi:threonine dehydrogenase-like Zn-dependent dehydrogenase
MYEGRTDVEKGKILGHENLGEVVEVGKAVDTVKRATKLSCHSISVVASAPIAKGA